MASSPSPSLAWVINSPPLKAPGFGDVSILAQKSPLAKSEPEGGLSSRAASSPHGVSRGDQCLGCSFCSAWKLFPHFSRGQANVTTQKNMMFFILICVLGDF